MSAHLCLIVPADKVNLARTLAGLIGGEGYTEGMFSAALYYVAQASKNATMGPVLPVGSVAAYCSVGTMSDTMCAAFLGGASSLLAAAQTAGWDGNVPDIADLCNSFYFDASQDASEVAQGRNGLSVTDPSAEV